jgi:hypothetical protein
MLPTMWATGRQLVTRCGGRPRHPQRSAMVAALRTLASDFGMLQIAWEQDAYRVDGTSLLGSVYRVATATQQTLEGPPCLEWLPKAGVTDLHLVLDGGVLRSVAHVIPRPPAHDTLANVMAWTLEKTGVIWVHPKRTKWCEAGPRQHGLRDRIVALVTNFPTLLVCQPRGQEVRFNATPSDHPITATVTPHGRLAVTTSGLDPPRHVKVCSQPELLLQLQLTARPEVEITRVHPHPHLSRRVSLWAAGRRRRLPRKHYKGFVKRAATNRGHEQIRQRAQKWSETSATAAQGLVLVFLVHIIPNMKYIQSNMLATLVTCSSASLQTCAVALQP